jgi:hypothetical protein
MEEKILTNEEIAALCRQLTVHVRLTQGSSEALKFFVNHIQPIEDYFEIL